MRLDHLRARLARLALPSLLLLPAACVDRTVSRVDPVPDHVETFEVPILVERDVDILFVIDSSQSMTEEHGSLRTDFGALLDRLDDGTGGLPDVRLGVISSSLGTAPYNVDSLCRADGGDRGLLHGAACAALGGATFIEDVLDADGSRRRNYTGTLEDAFGCIADVGVSGCGFEQHLESMRVALTPGTNPGFLRDDALLAVVVLADEDDCSASDPRLYDPNDTALGPITDFRCHAQGIVCDDDPVPAAPGTRTGCRPRPDSAYLEDIGGYVDFLATLKGDADRVIVAGIIGDPDRVQIGPDAFGRPSVLATCPDGGLGASEPGIRLASFLSRFRYSSRSTLCAGDLAAGLAEVGQLIDERRGRMCLTASIADRNPELPGVQAECSMVEVGDSGVERVVPSCDVAGDARPCWRIVDDAACADADHQRVDIDRGGDLAAENGTLRVQCVVE
jgi:hypothetical protein